MPNNPDLQSRFNTALGRLQSEAPERKPDRQRPILQRTQEASSAISRSTHEDALHEAANALASLWKTRR